MTEIFTLSLCKGFFGESLSEADWLKKKIYQKKRAEGKLALTCLLFIVSITKSGKLLITKYINRILTVTLFIGRSYYFENERP